MAGKPSTCTSETSTTLISQQNNAIINQNIHVRRPSSTYDRNQALQTRRLSTATVSAANRPSLSSNLHIDLPSPAGARTTAADTRSPNPSSSYQRKRRLSSQSIAVASPTLSPTFTRRLQPSENATSSPRTAHNNSLLDPSSASTTSNRGAASYFDLQPNSTKSAESPRSPPTRKPPASRSSHGIATSLGPPPALITRKSHSSDSGRKRQTPTNTAFEQQQLESLGLASVRTGGALSRSSSLSRRTNSQERPASATTRLHHDQATTSMSRTDSFRSRDGGAEGRLMTGGHGFGPETNGDYADRDQEQAIERALESDSRPDDSLTRSGSEDLFLNLAEDARRQQREDTITGRGPQPRSRTALAGQRQSLPQNTYASPLPRPSSSGQPFAHSSQHYARGLDNGVGHYRRASALASPGFNSRHYREQSPGNFSPERQHSSFTSKASGSGSEPQRVSPEIPQYGRRRPSIPNSHHTSQTRTYTNKSTNLVASSNYDSIPQLDPPQEPATSALYRADGTESVDSNTAPSTVWDELDELKSRIRKLELTGKMPATSGAAVSNASGERPRTATTTMTTISSSPRQVRNANKPPADGTIGGPAAANIHPNLHSALAKAKTLLSPIMYRPLEATAADALALATMTSAAGPQGTAFTAASIINGATVTDRQVRRKADNLCRSLTELTIALCDIKSEAVAQPMPDPTVEQLKPLPRSTSVSLRGTPMSKGLESPSVAQYGQSRRGSDDLETDPPRPSPSRALNRIEQRRTSLLGLNGGPTHGADVGSPREVTSHLRPGYESTTPTQIQDPVADRYRSGTSLLRTRQAERRPAHLNINNHYSLEEDPTLRAPSRAMTEIGSVGSVRLRPSTTAGQRAQNRANRLSRDYTSQLATSESASFPPPHAQSQQSSLHYSTSISGRRSYIPSSAGSTIGTATDSSNSPGTVHSPSLLRDTDRRRYLDRSSAPPPDRTDIGLERASTISHHNTPNAAEERAQRIASLSQYTATARSGAGSALGRTASLNRKVRERLVNGGRIGGGEGDSSREGSRERSAILTLPPGTPATGSRSGSTSGVE